MVGQPALPPEDAAVELLAAVIHDGLCGDVTPHDGPDMNDERWARKMLAASPRLRAALRVGAAPPEPPDGVFLTGAQADALLDAVTHIASTRLDHKLRVGAPPPEPPSATDKAEVMAIIERAGGVDAVLAAIERAYPLRVAPPRRADQ